MKPLLDKFPDRLSASLQSEGFQLTPWDLNEVVNEDMREFHRGTMQGLIGFVNLALQIVGIINNEPNNGQFAATMDKLESAARMLGYDVRVVEIWNGKLAEHLVRKRGYTVTGFDELTLKKSSPPLDL